MACIIWKGTPYHAFIENNDKTDPEDDIPDEDVNAIDEIPVYSINKPIDESLAVTAEYMSYLLFYFCGTAVRNKGIL